MAKASEDTISADLIALFRATGCEEWSLIDEFEDGTLMWSGYWPKAANDSGRWAFRLIGRVYRDGSFNVALQAQRGPGDTESPNRFARLIAELKAMALASAGITGD